MVGTHYWQNFHLLSPLSCQSHKLKSVKKTDKLWTFLVVTWFRLRIMLWTLNSKCAQYAWYKHYVVENPTATSVDFRLYSHKIRPITITEIPSFFACFQQCLTATAKYSWWELFFCAKSKTFFTKETMWSLPVVLSRSVYDASVSKEPRVTLLKPLASWVSSTN